MKITKAKLKQIIKEELSVVLKEGDDWYSKKHETPADEKYASRDPAYGISPTYMQASKEGDELQQQLAALNAEADAAFKAGDRGAYDGLVNQMIELENAHLDAGGELPLPRHTDDTQAIGE
jgi:hypothetical protein